MDTESVGNGKRVLIFPFVAMGHITPFFELAKKLSQRGFHVYLLSTPINLTFIHNTHSSIHLVELHLPESPELPPHRHTTNGLPPHLNDTLQNALKSSEPAFSDVVATLRPHLLIYDVLNPWAARVAESHSVPAVRLFTIGAAASSYLIHRLFREKEEYPFPELTLSTYDRERLHKLLERRRSASKDTTVDRNLCVFIASREMEGKYMDYISELFGGRKVLLLGLLVRPEQDDNDRFKAIMEWLGKKEENSTVYVSFGSECFLSDEEIQEMAYGLEESRVNFVWVVRFPNGEEKNLEMALPKGFLDRVGGRGRVVEGWAPQARILSHPSVGGFVSHCGWNSVMESVVRGVPIIALPMQFDQPVNAKLVVKIGVGVEVVRDDHTGKFRREDVAKSVGDVIRGKVGDTLRKSVKVMGENVRTKSLKEMDEAMGLMAHICRHEMQ
ncbi:unnamed protein product [Cuscuta campestris]|uniref:Glycosyltransferase n=1 Tax=Cuscuta campestris TaxID=132261 RepID=A0A484L7C4_9ASTE|nr:unnamed protein product [Cuscuta campestris]